MNNFKAKWLKTTAFLTLLILILIIVPEQSLDPWNILSPKKITSMILALSAFQIFGTLLAQFLGAGTGAIVSGFLGGIISSTATTASLAKASSHPSREADSTSEMLGILSATLAMLLQATAIVITGTSKLHISNLVIFIGPIIATAVIIYIQYLKVDKGTYNYQDTEFKLLPILQLSIFIILILTISKLSQSILGDKGLLLVTGVISLLEVHGSIIANIQLHELNGISINLLSSLLMISLASSYVSKLFLIWTLGSTSLKRQATKMIIFVAGAMVFSWIISFAL